MSVQKEIQVGPAKITVSEDAGMAKLAISMDQAVGGGEAAGVMTAKASIELSLDAKQGAHLGLALVKAHFPSLAGLIGGLESEIDGVLAAK